MYNKKADFGMPLYSPIILLVLALILIIFGIYFFILTNDKNIILTNNQIPNPNTAIILLESPLDPSSSSSNQQTIVDTLLLSYKEKSDLYEGNIDYTFIEKGKDECKNTCKILMDSVDKYLGKFTTINKEINSPSWIFLTFKMPENKPIAHLSRASGTMMPKFDKTTSNDYTANTALIPLEGGQGYLKIYLLY
jgi:hypothetical protein